MDLLTIANGRNSYPLTTIQHYSGTVSAIQTSLSRMGHYSGAADGRWSSTVDTAYKAFAKQYQFEGDQVSPRSAALLYKMLGATPTPSPTVTPQPVPVRVPSPPATPQPAPVPVPSAATTLTLQAIATGRLAYPITSIQTNRSIVLSIQTALNRLGFSAGAVDGSWGPSTNAAYRAFALRYGFNPNELSPRAASFILSSAGTVTPSPAPVPIPVPPVPRPPSPAPTPAPPVSRGNFDEALRFTLRWEGGYVNHPSDYGGATNKGVIQRVYDSYRRRKGLQTRSVLYITDDEVTDIYENDYWTPSQSPLMSRALAITQFDTAVNFGVRGAILFLQETLGVSADGSFGPVTRSALDRANTSATARRYVQRRIDYRYARVTQDSSQRVFLQGWLNRDNDLMRYISNIP